MVDVALEFSVEQAQGPDAATLMRALAALIVQSSFSALLPTVRYIEAFGLLQEVRIITGHNE